MTINKRNREKQLQDKRREKEARRQQRQSDQRERPPVAPGEDPDIAGIVPGPQPIVED